MNKQEKNCPICLKSYNPKKNRSCMKACSRSHLCCLSCIQKMILQKQKKCYTCRQDLDPQPHYKNQNRINEFINLLSQKHNQSIANLNQTQQPQIKQDQNQQQLSKCQILKKYYYLVILLFAVAGAIVLCIQIQQIQTCAYYNSKQCPYDQGNLCCHLDTKCPLSYEETNSCEKQDTHELQQKQHKIFFFSLGIIVVGSLTISYIILVILKIYQAQRKKKLTPQ